MQGLSKNPQVFIDNLFRTEWFNYPATLIDETPREMLFEETEDGHGNTISAQTLYFLPALNIDENPEDRIDGGINVTYTNVNYLSYKLCYFRPTVYVDVPT